MLQGSQQDIQARLRERDHEPCIGCGVDVAVDPVDGGLNCARCGQWQVLCDECMPAVPEYSREAVWLCPECR